jgi:hypothetical protein
MDQFMELGHEEEVVAADPMMEEDIEQTQEQQQQEQNIMTISKQIDQQQQNQAINGHHRRHDQVPIDQIPSTSQQHEQSKQNGEEHRKCIQFTACWFNFYLNFHHKLSCAHGRSSNGWQRLERTTIKRDG